MSFKTILVLLDEAKDSSARLDVACGLAEAHGAHLNALAMSQQFSTYMAAGIDAAAATVDVGQIEESRQQAQSIAKAAKTQIDTRGVLGEARWTSHEAFGLREWAGVQGRHADLTLVGQPADEYAPELREAALEGALISSGRPVLMIPVNWDKPISTKSVVVAWDGSREAARALGDAVPFLDQAASVTVVVVDPKPGYEGLGPDPGADIATVIARHCSNVELDRIPSSGAGIAGALLARATSAAADLIVMGGYGHSIIRESLFGGVSSEMINKSTIPLLLSH
ncbi:MAG: universal stress protein [Alphaproteobacteria bacterium]|nr:universal stress protein [Alphaproteobacteria bacterium]